MKKYNGKSIRKGKTSTGKLPDSVGGFGSSKTGGGVIFNRSDLIKKC
jgi:hypothetical protein